MTVTLEELKKALLQELEKRKQKNPRYSIRTFASAVGISKSTLALFLLSHHKISKLNQEKAVAFIRSLGPSWNSWTKEFESDAKNMNVFSWIHIIIVGLMVEEVEVENIKRCIREIFPFSEDEISGFILDLCNKGVVKKVGSQLSLQNLLLIAPYVIDIPIS